MKKTITFIFTIFSFSGFAQDDLSLSESIQKALTNNFQIRLIKSNYEISQTQNNWSQAGLVPTVSINLTNTNNLSDNTNNPASFFPGLVLSDNLQASLDISWTLFSGFGIRINKERFEQLEEQTKGNAIVVIESTIYNVIINYFTAVTQKRKLEILAEMLAFSKTKLDFFQMKADMGLETSLDLLEFKNQVLIDSSNYLLQDLAYKNAKRNLNLEMGESVEQIYNLTDKLEFDIPKATYSELYDYMVSKNQSVKNQYIVVQLQELNVQARQSSYYPVVSLNLGATPSVGHIQLFGDQPFSTGTNAVNYYGNVSVRYTLFNGMQRQQNIEIAKIQEDIAILQYDELKLKLAHNLRAIFELYQTQSKLEDMALERVQYSKMLWEMGTNKYQSGLINVFNLNDIKLGYEQAVLTYYDRLFDLLKTHYDLMRITGTISQEYSVNDSIDSNN